MKIKHLLLTLSIALCSLSIPLTSFSQDTAHSTEVVTSGSVTTGNVDPVTVAATDPVIEFFGSIAGILMLSMVVTGWLVSRSTSMSGTLKQIISWLVPVAICLFGSSMHYGIFANITLPISAGVGVLIAATANGLWDAGTLDKILALLGVKVG